jgi:hypothetical protein
LGEEDSYFVEDYQIGLDFLSEPGPSKSKLDKIQYFFEGATTMKGIW